MEIISITVKPNIPESLRALDEIAHNLWISWNFDAIMLFMRLDPDAWAASGQNPVKMLGLVSQARLEETAGDDSFLSALERVYARFKAYVDGKGWYAGARDNAIAYFSMEYGLDVSLPVYSGGLGVLSGDHLKSASDLDIPLVGVGLLYRQGYFKQYLNPDGFQQESYPENDWYNLPVSICADDTGTPIKIRVRIGHGDVQAQIWDAKVGRNSLYLLDTNIEENSEADREITAALYGGDREMRIRQEILLGIGGLRALKAVGVNPAVTHMNEGHSVFLALEKVSCLMKQHGLSFHEAVVATRPTSVFTTHTPVPAGNERFSPALMHTYFHDLAAELGVSWKEFLGLGRAAPEDDTEDFCLTVMALRLSAYSNGVSKLHGQVSRRMWQNLWPDVPMEETPITHITNGVHPRTWLSHDMVDVFDRYLGPRFADEPAALSVWDQVSRISDEELWRTHERRRERLVAFVRMRLREQFSKRGIPESELAIANEVLSPYALTICFARRFATYKRGNLLLREPEHLIRLLSNNDFPVQLIFAGKAHPHDLAGKEMIREIVHFSRDPMVRTRVVFLEDYDMTMARYLVAGSDVWLNAPRRPMEASGTSGMKAAINGSLNVSILDGWWDEAYSSEIGWSIGQGEEYSDPDLQDEIERKALYDLLEEEIVPLFYTRGRDGLPREWIRRMKASISGVGKHYNSHRMLMEYSDRFYIPALQNYDQFSRDRCGRAREVSAYLDRLRTHWSTVSIRRLEGPEGRIVLAGDMVSVTAVVDMDGLDANEIAVELYYGPISSTGRIERGRRAPMTPGEMEDGARRYTARVLCSETGRQGITARIVPKHPGLINPMLPGMVVWA